MNKNSSKAKGSPKVPQESEDGSESNRRDPATAKDSSQEETSIPLSGFKTTFVNSSKWADVERISDIDDQGPDKNRIPGERFSETTTYDIFSKRYDPYPSWGPAESVPISRVEIEAIFIQLSEIFGFQYDNAKNMFDYLLRLLDSRASRVGTIQSLRSLHADYIGGVNANFKKWYFAAQLDIDDSVGFDNVDSNGRLKSNKDEFIYTLDQAESQWCINMNNLSPTDCIIQIALYLLCWGEANNVRFMPECLCFIFKCCNDYYYSLDVDVPVENITPSFLDHAITPLYNFYRDQSYIKIDGVYYHNDKDHKDVIGYDDMNQLFWYSKGLERLVLKDKKTKFMSLQPNERYLHLNDILWHKAFYKTFKEKRTWLHVLCNFSRIWIIHICMYWYYTSFNSATLYTHNYHQSLDNQPTIQARLSVMALSGAIAAILSFISVLLEVSFVPRKWPGAMPVLKRLGLLIIVFILNLAPSIYILAFNHLNSQTKLGLAIAGSHFALSVITVSYLSIVPLSKLFGDHLSIPDRKGLPAKSFAANFHKLQGTDRVASYGLWIAIFASKFIESYFFLTLSLKDPVRELSMMTMNRCAGDQLIGKWLCLHQAKIVLLLIYVTDLILFFLDTYLWYIIWNTIFSVCRSFYIGFSIWTPWRNIFSRLPKRIFSKIIATSNDKNIKAKLLVSQAWNSIIISMYREHLLTLEHVQKLIYKQITTGGVEGGTVLKEPTFFVSQEDQSMKSTLFYEQSEAQRRITFFAQSLSTPMPEIGSTNSMPSFTVLIPHYSEKITLSLREIIREEDQYSHVTMLEYLKQLHQLEWACFVKDTKMLAEEFDTDSSSFDFSTKEKHDDLPYYSVGFKVATPEYILRTRIWASLRSQTLYRTISGFMNYSRAIKLLFDVENPDLEEFESEYAKLEEASVMALRKFRIVVSMQRFKYFSAEEKENKEFLLRAYPELQITYIDEEVDERTGESTYYSVLIDGSCSILENGERKPKYRIRLSGNPILGDGKSDNQNHAVIFCRGEYIQLVDANQDNYLEECLKIRSVLAEFEESTVPLDPYSTDLKNTEYANPVAIIGTREYIFSENIGILGDVAAGKEQTFGTLFARTLAHIGGKLHYGHPDFLNSIFMTTRGGVSKAQKGLHLNEDIYAGMNAVLRGGRIKHCEYIQCGKGRDLGFGSILNFTTKIGAGMGEQMLSREYYYMSSNLSMDRFLSFYYAHPGFHLNNVFIILSIKLFLLVAVNLAALTNETTLCEYNKHKPITDPRKPQGCYNLIPVVLWLERCIYSIFSVFVISFVPLWVQELTERGLYKALTRLGKHFASLSPLFEVFVCRIYAQSLMSDIAIGGARYIATGRGFATIRVPFAKLYSRFASESLYFGAISGLIILYCSLAMWKLPLLFFWFTVIGLLISPFLYNPNQFSWNDFFLDYKVYLQWLYGGNSKPRGTTWISHTRITRSRKTGIKHHTKSENEEIKAINDVKPSRISLVFTHGGTQLIVISLLLCAYLFSNAQNESRNVIAANSLPRILFVSIGPIAVNTIILIFFFVVSLVIGPFCCLIFKKFPAFISFIVHILAVLNQVLFFELLWFFQRWDFPKTILGMAVSVSIQSWILGVLSSLLLSRENKHDKTNRAWWSGRWVSAGLGIRIFTQPIREFLCKIGELHYFAADLVIGHVLLFCQFPILLIPYVDKWHPLMLFWLRPGSQLRPRVLSKKQKRVRRMKVQLYTFIFLLGLCLFVAIFVIPIVATKVLAIDFEQYMPDILNKLIQPAKSTGPRKGLAAQRAHKKANQ
ncbi:Piso0_005257 [Millerozyma farinosa CBS 7064]|uniref:1,3-beta-glucan synthase n=1 Tax=Pichia sorbitophila (strain ATCC MYA-4447 / BCRC 22081 / CBS 7064 / NBRC 10061 / NRRL Y-12695) TaxID=559304 RepID=G8Y4M1_PICSO|nr:Piso0_005257 [Millerozyma farinosa CBS 7064]